MSIPHISDAAPSRLAARGPLHRLAVPLSLAPMEAKAVDELPADAGWRFEPKWDGFRCLAFKAGGEVELKAKSGKSLSRYFPEMVHALRALPAPAFVLDGELTIVVDGRPSFEALQMRLHPAASRIAKLAAETPACLVLFDRLLDEAGHALLGAPFADRRAGLKAFFHAHADVDHIRLSPGTLDRDEAQAWLDKSGAGTDGVVAKRLDGAYRPGERAMLKIKRRRTADCVVGGFRYEQDSRCVGSLLLGLYDGDGLLHHVGFTSTLTDAERPELTRRLEGLVQPPGFTGAAPGGPSRWSGERSTDWRPLRPELVVEVRFDHVTGDRFRHGTRLMRWRPDKAPGQCRMEQLR